MARERGQLFQRVMSPMRRVWRRIACRKTPYQAMDICLAVKNRVLQLTRADRAYRIHLRGEGLRARRGNQAPERPCATKPRALCFAFARWRSLMGCEDPIREYGTMGIYAVHR